MRTDRSRTNAGDLIWGHFYFKGDLLTKRSQTVQFEFDETQFDWSGCANMCLSDSNLEIDDLDSSVFRKLVQYNVDALASRMQSMIDSGQVETHQQLAELGRISQPRMTQILSLLQSDID